MLRRAAFAILVSAAACSPPWPDPPPAPDLTPVAGQAEFSAIIWRELGGPGEPPAIEWVTGARLNCDDGTGYWEANTTEGGPFCLAGGYSAGEGHVTAARPGRPNMAVVAHEFTHVVQFRRGLPQGHVSPWFRDDGVYLVGGPVDVAVKAARAAGY